MFACAYIESEEHGNVTARFDREHLLVGYHKPHQVAKWPRFEIGGHPLAICPETLARLEGKRLTLRKKIGHSDICPYVLVAEYQCAAPNGGPATPSGNVDATDRPPSVS